MQSFYDSITRFIEGSGENEQRDDRDRQHQGADDPPNALGIAAQPALEGGDDADQRRNPAGQGDEEGEQTAIAAGKHLDRGQGRSGRRGSA